MSQILCSYSCRCAGHSFSALAKTDEILLNLDQFKGVLAFDEDKSQCTVQSDTRLYDLGKYLAPINQSLANQRDSVSIFIQQFYKQDYHAIFDLVEPILQKY